MPSGIPYTCQRCWTPAAASAPYRCFLESNIINNKRYLAMIDFQKQLQLGIMSFIGNFPQCTNLYNIFIMW